MPTTVILVREKHTSQVSGRNARFEHSKERFEGANKLRMAFRKTVPFLSREVVNQKLGMQIDTIYVIDDDSIQSKSVARLCNSVGFKAMCFSAPREFFSIASTLKPGCALIDMRMPEMDGLEVFAEITKRTLPITSVMFTGYADTAVCRAAFRAGIFDFVAKDSEPHEIIEVIHSAMTHRRNINGHMASDSQSETHWGKLSDREAEVADLLIDGTTLKGIAFRLGISVQTASKHRTRVFDKIGVSSEIELLRSLPKSHRPIPSLFNKSA
jgi:two-component system, LuxR family, response regulator FixJ